MNECVFCLASLLLQADVGYQWLPSHADNVVLEYDRNGGSPLLSAFAVGLQADITPRVTFAVSFRHESMPTVYDYGVNAVWTSVTWRPFK